MSKKDRIPLPLWLLLMGCWIAALWIGFSFFTAK